MDNAKKDRIVIKNTDKAKIIILSSLILLAFYLHFSRDGLLFPGLGNTTEIQNTLPGSSAESTTTLSGILTFKDNGGAVETKDGKPVIRLFSTTWCPHCIWVKQTYEDTVMEYVNRSEIIAYHWELDIDDDTLRPEKIPVPDKEREVFYKFNPGRTIPTFVFGGKYYRVGNGYEATHDLNAEQAEFRAVIEKLIKEAKESSNKT